MFTLGPRIQSNTTNSSTTRKGRAPVPPNKSKEDKIINIVLIGESGVGKSTFINAFANYLQFKSFSEAENGEPTVIIPVSFFMTANDNFDEHIVKFGEPDPNENHMSVGQSVTQHCRSYVFNISSTKRLRIIDTPGFGDTRGSDQDENNMKMIISYLNNIQYIHGICLLFKPNVQQLHPYWNSCFRHLFQYFSENLRNHLMFCFTNCRSTFYAPGDTRPALLSLLKSLPVDRIQFDKTNTFCFDSESFRYLVAIKEKLTFKDLQKEEFEKSWDKSVEESHRFKGFLCEELKPFHRSKQWKSIRDAQYQIIFTIRPILEGMRNIIRNILLHDKNCLIQLQATSVDRSMVINYSNERCLEHCDVFWIFSDHLISSPIECNGNEYNRTEYRLNYRHQPNQQDETIEILRDRLKTLCDISSIFAHLLMAEKTNEQDPFLLGLNQMIEEEYFICRKYPQNELNKQLISELEMLKTQYEGSLNYINAANNSNDELSKIYDLIESLDAIPVVKEQMDATKKYQEDFVKLNERDSDVRCSHL